MKTFPDLFEAAAFVTFENQFRLAHLLGEHDWSLDTHRAVVSFTPSGLEFPVQFLGTHSEQSNTWLWADCNAHSALPSAALASCRAVRHIGRSHELPCFVHDQFSLVDQAGEPTAETLALVATHLSGCSAYYRSPYEGGSVYFAFSDKSIDEQPGFDFENFVDAYKSLLWGPGHMRVELDAYVAARGLDIKESSRERLIFTLPSGQDVGLEFEYGEQTWSIGFLPGFP